MNSVPLFHCSYDLIQGKKCLINLFVNRVVFYTAASSKKIVYLVAYFFFFFLHGSPMGG